MEFSRQERLLELFFRGLRGEGLSVQALAQEYDVSTKSITRSINDLKAFLANHRALVGNAELRYSHQSRRYHLAVEEFLSNQELFAVIEVLIGARAFSREELLRLTEKLKRFTTPEERPRMQDLIRKELYHYPEVKHDCESVQATLWQLICCITDRREITIDYYRMDRALVTHRLRPASVLFTDFYFYLIAFRCGENQCQPVYFRVDRIKRIVVHRTPCQPEPAPAFDEGLLRRRSLFMWPGKLRTVRFYFSGPSLQAVLDKLPTAKVIERSNGWYLIEAEVYGDGIKMWLLSQGSWVQVIAPDEFVAEMQAEIAQMYRLYQKQEKSEMEEMI